MVSFFSRYETFTSNTNFPQAIFLANTANTSYAVDPHRTQPRGAAHYPFRD